MAGWSGFSEEDLRRMHQKEPVSSSGRGRKPAPTNRSRQQLQRERALCQAAQQRDASAQLPPEQQLAKPAVRTPNQTAPKITPENKSEKSATSQLQESVVVNYHSVPIPEPTIMAKELEKQEVELREKTRLELLQQEQRMMEEKNKRKKALLAKTIAEKSKQTQAEAVKLKKIQKELQALDDMVSNDIGILRGRIEQASWDYSTARKRYEKAEAEYVSAKLDLHSKTEVKEQLTEHLYAIIQENEQRKARKLEQLMRQLELQEDEERLELEIQVDHMLQEVEAQEEVKARVETGGQVERGGQGEVQGGGEVQTQVEGGGQVEVQTQVEGGGQVEVQIQVEGGGQVEVQTQVEVEVEVKAQVETDTPVESLLTESQTEPKTSNPPDSVAAEVPTSPS